MSGTDPNLLAALDMLLAECSVTRAAERLNVSTSDMNRTFSFLRAVTGDPLLVSARRGLVPTPRAMKMRTRIHESNPDANAILRPLVNDVDVESVKGTFTIRASQSFMELFSDIVLKAVTILAPRLCLKFEVRPQDDAQSLRKALVDLEINLLGAVAPKTGSHLHTRNLYVGVARAGHPILARNQMTAKHFVAFNHVLALEEGDGIESLSDELEYHGLERMITVVVPRFPDAMRIACRSDLIAVVPRSLLDDTRLRSPVVELISFDLPTPHPRFEISVNWNPHKEKDPLHRFLRNCIISLCQTVHPFDDD